MYKRIKKIITNTDQFLYQKFGSNKGTKLLDNIKEAQVIFSLLNETGKESKVRFVGGCVRKSISGEEIDDIDLATSLEPDEVKKKLTQKNIKVIDTGIEHGTITAILNKKKFEITTLRKDVITDGRHARVEFSSNWELDASRRDFTINAIYVDSEGRIFDPLKGVLDLQNGKVKFIGEPEERIQEDYLRILRYFRFSAQYSKTDYDHNTIRSIKKNINGLNKVTNERIFSELEKILMLENIYNLFSNNYSKDIMQIIFPLLKHDSRLKKISVLNKKIRNKYDNCLILALLILDESNDYEYFCHKYKTSNEIRNRFKNISKNLENIKTNKFYTKENIKKLIYFSNRGYVKDLLLFSLSTNNKITVLRILELIEYVDVCSIPKFPISGDYLKQYGYETGHALGKQLKLLKDKWIKNNFVIDKDAIKRSLENSKEN